MYVNDDDDGWTDVKSSGDHMTLRFKMGTKSVTLELDENENIPQLPTYYTAENGKLIQWTVDEGQVKLSPAWVTTDE